MPTIRVTCPECQAVLAAADKLAGRAVKCPKCGKSLQISARPE
ncbi:MAG: MJ0042-type zinc finger domain-containing protein, partial [Fimbriiglobus sp.]